MKKFFFLLVAFMFVTSNIFAQEGEKLSGTLTTSMSYYGTYNESYPITNANDGSYSTKFWSDGGPSTNDYVTMTLTSVSSIGEIKFYFESGDQPEHATVEISSDNSAWEPVATITLADISDNTFTCNANGLIAQYVRLRFTQSQGNWFQMQEFEVYEEPAVLAERTISVSVNDATMGTAYIGTEGVTEVSGQTKAVKMTAVPAEGFKFINWTLDGTEFATSLTCVDRTEGDKAYVANFAAKEVYQVSVAVNNSTMGTAVSTAEGSVYEGTQITLTATANEGYEFVNWTVGEEVVGKESTLTTVVNATAVYNANFRLIPTKLNVSNVTSNMSISAYYDINDLVDGSYSSYLYSSASAGSYVILELAEESVVGDIKLYLPSYTSYIPEEAKFQFSTDNVVWNDVEGCTFVYGDVKKDSKTGYFLATVDAKATVAKYVKLTYVTLPSYGSFYVNEIEVYEAPVEVAARAISVSVNDATMGIAYIGTEGTTEVTDQTTGVKMFAVANEGYEFVNWTVNGEVVGTSATLVDKTEGDKAYVANFIALATYSVSVSVNDAIMGSAEASKTGDVVRYTEVTFTATANEGYEFVNWTVDGEEVSKENPYVASIEASADYKANFRMPLAKLTLTEAESTMAHYYDYVADNMIDGSYTSIYDTSSRQNEHDGDIIVTVTLAEESTIGEVKIYFSGNFIPNVAKIQVSKDKEVWNDVEGAEFKYADAIYDSEKSLYVVSLDCKSEVAKYVRMYVTEPNSTWMTIAEFEVYESPVNVAPRTISVSVNDATMGSAYVGVAGMTELAGQTAGVKVVATPASNAYRFVNWTVDGVEVSTNSTFVDRTEGDKEYVANFEAKPIYTISVTSANELLGTVESTAGEVVYEGDEVTFTATAADGYMFSAWTTASKDTVSVSNPYTFTATSDLTLVANFDRDPLLDRSEWTITASSEETSGEGTGNGLATCIIDGKTNTHWHSAWKESSPAYPHWFLIDMKESKAFDAFEYVSRGAGSSTDDSNNNGNIVNYQLYTSDTEIDPAALQDATLVTSGLFTYDGVNKVHRVEFNSVKGQYVMLYATGQSANGGKHASCVEFYLYSSNFAVSVASADEAMGTVYIQEEGVTSVGCSVEGTDVVTLTAVPADKYQFVNWTLNGEVVSTDAVYTTDLVTESRAYVANFEFAPVAPRTITAVVNNVAKGSVVFTTPASTESSVVSDNIVVLEATPATTDDFFVNWTIDGVEVGTETTYKYLDAVAATIQANFISKYIVSVEPNTDGKVSIKYGDLTISSGDRVLEGEEVTITVTANRQRELKELYVNGVNVFAQYKAAGYVYKTTVTEGITISTVYGDPVCYFTYSCTGNGWIEAYESDTYDEGAEEEGTLELPVSPDGYQYAYGEEVPFLSTLAIFPVAGEGDELISISINGEEYEVTEDSDVIYYGDIFIDPVEGPIHVEAVFSGVSTGVESAEVSETSIYAVAGGIVVEVAEAATASIYSIAGVLVSEQTVSDNATIAMEKGVYIVKVADKVAKVIVK